MPQLRLLLLGTPGIELAGRRIVMDTQKATALLAYLAVTGQAHSRETLAALFWPDYDQHRAYANLRRTLWSVNKALGAEWLDAGADLVGLASFPADSAARADLWVDVAAFREHLAEGGAASGKSARRHGHAAGESCPDCLAALAAAAEIYRSDFLSGFNLRDSPDFDEWQFFQSETLRRELAAGLEKLVAGHAATNDWELAIGYARRWLALDPLHEPAHRVLMRLYAAAGQRSAALRQFAECARILQTELGATPEAETAALYEQIKTASGRAAIAQSEAVRDAERPRPASQPRVAGREVFGDLAPAGAAAAPAASANLPSQPTPFVGRLAELAEIAAALADPACRLLTLVGPGGIGKTRLALQAAGAQVPKHAGGAWFVALAEASSPHLAAQACAAALGLTPREAQVGGVPGESVRVQLLDYLRGRELLLVLDNFEHLIGQDNSQIDAIGMVREILSAAPGVKLLVTSRERLNLAGEWVLSVPGMAYPGAPGSPGAESGAEAAALTSFSAVQLFLQTARRVRVGFDPTEADLRAIACICRAVDGAPLAIELASAWTRLLSCGEIAAEISRSLDFLTASERGIPERHRSLRAVFEHSWQLLDAEERQVFSRLSVFQGGFTREAAERVADANLGILSSLADKSLLRRSAPTRFDLHEVLRQYAGQKLEEASDQLAEARARHAGYFREMLDNMNVEIRGRGQMAVLACLEAEAANVRLAHRWLITHAPAALRRCTPPLFLYYNMRGLIRQGEEVLRPALDRLRALHAENPTNEEIAAGLAISMAVHGQFFRALGRAKEGALLLEEALSISRGLPTTMDKALALMILDFGALIVTPAEASENHRLCLAIARAAGDAWSVAMTDMLWAGISQGWLSAAERLALCRDSLAAFEGLGDRWCLALCNGTMAKIAHWGGDFAEARKLALRSLEIYLDLGDQWRILDMRFQLGLTAMSLGAYDEARRYYEENLSFAIETGRRTQIASHLDCLGYLAFQQGQTALAEEHYQRSLALYRQLDDHGGTAMALNNLGDGAQSRGDFEEAERLYAEAAALAAKIDYPWVIAISHKNLGKLFLRAGDLRRAEENLHIALRAAVAMDNPSEIMDALAGWAGLLAATGRPPEAAEVLGMIEHQESATQAVRDEVRQRLAGLAGRLSPEGFAAARSRGKTLDPVVWLRNLGADTARTAQEAGLHHA